MSLIAIPFPMIDPIAFEIGPVSVRWYGLAYMAGLLLGWYYIRLLIQNDRLWRGSKAPVTADQIDDLLLWVTLGVVVGGRLGFVFLYQPGYFLANPAKILAVWQGGMSFHGALLGVCFACYLFARRHRIPFFSLSDVLCAAAPIGICLGRIANFINSEHFGRPTSVSWGVIFPNGGPLPRHPSQLYEAALEGILLFIVLRFLSHNRLALKNPGLVTGAFFIGYGCARILVEFFRLPEASHIFNLGPVTVGQIYSIPMIVAGAIFWIIARRRKTAAG